MLFCLAVEVDFVTIGSMLVAVFTVAGTTLTTAWIGVRKLCVYLWAWGEPKVTKAIEEHTGLVADMRNNVPVVANTMQLLADTQQQQCKALERLSEASDRHEQLHARTGEKLELIVTQLNKVVPRGESDDDKQARQAQGDLMGNRQGTQVKELRQDAGGQE